MRGRDIRRYSFEFADLWLIATFPSRKYDIERYPAVKKYLLDYGYNRLKQTGEEGARKKTANKWFETQDSIGYWEDFFRQKIAWKAVGRNLAFSIVEEGIFITAPAAFLTSSENEYLLGILSSSYARYHIYNNSDTTGAGDIMLNVQSLERIPIPKPIHGEKNAIIQNVKQLLIKSFNSSNRFEKEIDKIIYNMFGFEEEEISFIESSISE